MYAELYGRNTKFGMAVLGVFTMSFHPPATSPRQRARARARARGGRGRGSSLALLRADKARPYV